MNGTQNNGIKTKGPKICQATKKCAIKIAIVRTILIYLIVKKRVNSKRYIIYYGPYIFGFN